MGPSYQFRRRRKIGSPSPPRCATSARWQPSTGLWPNSEIFLLEWSNIDLQRQTGRAAGFIHVAQGKTDAATRNMVITAAAHLPGPRKNIPGALHQIPPRKQHLASARCKKHSARAREGDPRGRQYSLSRFVLLGRHTLGTRWRREREWRSQTRTANWGRVRRVWQSGYYIDVTGAACDDGVSNASCNDRASKLADCVEKQTERLQ